MHHDNLYAGIPDAIPAEIFETLLNTAHFRLERIISQGQATAAGTWYDQDDHEWVLLLKGRAGLRLDGEVEPRVMQAGDWVHIAAHRRHRVEWTDPAATTIWLALHYR